MTFGGVYCVTSLFVNREVGDASCKTTHQDIKFQDTSTKVTTLNGDIGGFGWDLEYGFATVNGFAGGNSCFYSGDLVRLTITISSSTSGLLGNVSDSTCVGVKGDSATRCITSSTTTYDDIFDGDQRTR